MDGVLATIPTPLKAGNNKTGRTDFSRQVRLDQTVDYWRNLEEVFSLPVAPNLRDDLKSYTPSVDNQGYIVASDKRALT